MDKVEKVARAIYEARGAHEPPRAWRKWEDIGDEARAVWCQCATAALTALGEREGEIARLAEARRKDAEAFESLRNANTIVRDRAKKAEALVERYKVALADAIRRPMGVTPDSAVGLVTTAELDAAEERRPRVAEGASRSPSEIVVHGDFAVVALSRGLTATIDAADVPLVEGFRWSALTNGQTGHAYAARWDKGRCVLMHRVLLAAPPGTQVDHIDGDGLNNRRVNIRICTPEQNQANRVVERRNQIGMKGVSPRRGKYRAQITPDGKTVDLGTYKTADEAAAAYRGAARILWGDFAKE